MKLAIAIVLWAACGFYAWGTMMADWDRWHNTPRDHLGLCMFYSLLGPLGAFLAAFLSNFNQHGWQLWERR